jgi:hypothetical protein
VSTEITVSVTRSKRTSVGFGIGSGKEFCLGYFKQAKNFPSFRQIGHSLRVRLIG